MKYAAVLVLFLAVCAGCQSSGIRGGLFKSQGQYRSWKQGPPPGQARSRSYTPGLERFSAGLSFGQVLGYSSDAVDGFQDSEFETGTLTGANFAVFFPPQGGGDYNFYPRFGVEIRLDEYGMLLTENSFEFGRLKLSTTTVAFKSQWMPVHPNMVGFHCDAGFGSGSCSFRKDSMLLADELALGYYTEVDPGAPVLFALGGGVDFFFSPEACISLDLREVFIVTPVDWYEDGLKRPEIDWFDASNTQFTLSLRVFF